MFFRVYLRKLDKDELTGQQFYIKTLMDDSDPSFFPIKRALCLEDDTAADLDTLAGIAKGQHDLEREMAALRIQIRELTALVVAKK